MTGWSCYLVNRGGNMQEIALITGGGSGIGRALAHKMAEEGNTVLIIGRHLKTLSETRESYPQAIHILRGDISDPGDRENIKNYINVNKFKIKYLVQNAAVLQPVKSLLDISLAEWRDHQAINVEGPLFLAQILLPYLAGGRILHISSGAAHHAYQGWGAYCTSKAALYMIYQVLKEELGEHNIIIGSLRPGVVDTPMQDEVRDTKKEFFPALQRFIDMKENDELIKPEAVANYIYWMLTQVSDEQFSIEEADFKEI